MLTTETQFIKKQLMQKHPFITRVRGYLPPATFLRLAAFLSCRAVRVVHFHLHTINQQRIC
ncbi:hypothetical protein BHG88_RS27285, partial [Escherichia coli]